MLGLEGYWLLVRGGYYKQKALYEAECCKATLEPKLLLLSRQYLKCMVGLLGTGSLQLISRKNWRTSLNCCMEGG